MNPRPPTVLVQGQPTSVPYQGNLRGAGTQGIMNETDILSASVITTGVAAPVYTPDVAFYTANSTQTGYGQAQVEVSYETADVGLMVPSVHYTVVVWRALASSPSILEAVVRYPIVVEPLAIP
jgi:hypothetical protein